ncbi:MAG: hypothetical protein ACI94Y_003824 [Maribacter sp.]|jgi:hypothetical protein
MKNHYLILFFIGLLSCQNKDMAIKQPLAESLIIQSLEAIDISENMASVSTQNDEIFFMVSYVNKIDNYYHIINEQIFKELLFDSLHYTYQWKDKIALDEIDYIIFSLGMRNK